MNPIRRSVYLIVLLGVVGYMLFATYGEVRRKTIEEFNSQQMIIAGQVARGVENYFRSLLSDLVYLAGIESIVFLDERGKEEMLAYFAANAKEIRALTRVDAKGRILHTVPYLQEAVGADLSSQKHVATLMKTRAPVVSDVFATVQGYRAVAVHVPVFFGGAFHGSLAALVPYEAVSGNHLAEISSRLHRCGWIISQRGAILHSNLPPAGDGALPDMTGGSGALAAMTRDMKAGKRGKTAFSYEVLGAGAVRKTTFHAVYQPIRLGNTLWSVAVATPERDVLATMQGFRNKLLFLMAVLMVAGLFLSHHFLRALSVLKSDRDRSRSAEALRQSEEKYRHLADSLPQIVFETDGRGKLTFANRVAFEWFGYTRESFQEGLDAVDMLAPGDRSRAMEDMSRVLGGEAVGEREYLLQTKDGDTFPGMVYSSRIERDGRIAGIRGVVADLSRMKRAEAALRSEEQKFRALVEESPVGVVMVGKTGDYEYVNPKFTELFGYVHTEVPSGREWFRRAFPDPVYRETVISQWLQDLHAQRRGNTRPRAYDVTCKDGTVKHIHFRMAPLSAGGRLVTFEDVTDIKRLEVQLRQAQRMEAIGTLAGGVAHDFNNLLMGIQGLTSIIRVNLKRRHRVQDHLKGIEAYVKSASDLTKQLLGFGRGGKYEVLPTDLNERIKSQNRMFGRTKKEIRVRGGYEKELWTVAVDRGQFDQVLLNLYVNAWQAMPHGGEINVRTRNVELAAEEVAPYNLEPGRYVNVTVSDNGVGMDDATRQRIFDPFFTTKGLGRGTGLGLASVYGIIKNHGGFIEVESVEGAGSVFDIYLPAVATDHSSGPNERKKTVNSIEKGSGTVLLVDDEEMIVDVGGQMLQALGYSVVTASNGDEALEAYREKGEAIDIVILDMVMPGMGGGETYDRLKAVDPDIKVILSSGYSLDGEASDILARGCQGFIQKPFNLEELSHKVKEVL